MSIQVKIGDHTPAERSNEYLAVIDALLAEDEKRAKEAKGAEYATPNASFTVPADKAGSIKRQMREAAHLRNKTARLTEEAEVEVKKGEDPQTALTYILTERIVRTTEDEAADENADA